MKRLPIESMLAANPHRRPSQQLPAGGGILGRQRLAIHPAPPGRAELRDFPMAFPQTLLVDPSDYRLDITRERHGAYPFPLNLTKD